MREPGTPMTEAAKSVVAPPVRAAGSGGASPASESGESGSPTARRSVAATGQVLSGGRRVVTAAGQITGPDGTLYAHASTTCLVFEPRLAQEQPAQEKGPSGRSAENGHGR